MGFNAQQGAIAFKTQSAKGTPATNMATEGIAMYRTGGSLSPNVELMTPDAEIGGHRDTVDALLGPISNGGDLEFYTRFESIGFLLKAALGAPVSAAGTVSGTHEHVFTPSDAQLLPFFTTWERIGAGLQRVQYTDCVVNTLSLECDPDGYLTGSVGIIGCRALYGVPDINVQPILDETKFTVGSNIKVMHAGADLKSKGFSLEINNNFDDSDFRMGSRYIEDLTPGQREVTGSVNLRHESDAIMRSAVLGSAVATTAGGLTSKEPVIIEIESYGEIDGAATPTTNRLEIEFPNVIFEPFGFEPSGADQIEGDVSWRAVRPEFGTPVLTATLLNGLAALP
ncbi:minor tail protein [Gordonia phage Demosthenes]|uniref:Major tail protein n=1 Tax=Gordonia phage Demosthenes TaxID=1838067 RepID=A0A166Y6K0_9CAUD|nr:minor tail protein [Gordonia phage Demosthenes]ANA85993.1 major tail protein [Gordonia phage Demosthenes]